MSGKEITMKNGNFMGKIFISSIEDIESKLEELNRFLDENNFKDADYKLGFLMELIYDDLGEIKKRISAFIGG